MVLNDNNINNIIKIARTRPCPPCCSKHCLLNIIFLARKVAISFPSNIAVNKTGNKLQDRHRRRSQYDITTIVISILYFCPVWLLINLISSLLCYQHINSPVVQNVIAYYQSDYTCIQRTFTT